MDIISLPSSRHCKQHREPIPGHATPSYHNHGGGLMTEQHRQLFRQQSRKQRLNKQQLIKPGSRTTTRRAAAAGRRSKPRSSSLRWDEADEPEDGEGLVASDAGEPNFRRMPRLQRQEAFRAPKPWERQFGDRMFDDAELYRMGILYDDNSENTEHEHDAHFCLNAIVHVDPVYSLRNSDGYGHNRRMGKRRMMMEEEEGEDDRYGHYHHHQQQQQKSRFSASAASTITAEQLMLSVELLSQHLEDEAAIKRLLLAPAIADEEKIAYEDEEDGGFRDPGSKRIFQHYHPLPSLHPHASQPQRQQQQQQPHITVIYELIESATPTSPGTPATTTAATTATATTTERDDLLLPLPDLVSDTEDCDSDSDSDSDSLIREWDVIVPTPEEDDDVVINAPAADCDMAETGTGTATATATGASDDDVWVVIAGGDS